MMQQVDKRTGLSLSDERKRVRSLFQPRKGAEEDEEVPISRTCRSATRRRSQFAKFPARENGGGGGAKWIFWTLGPYTGSLCR